MPLPRCNSAWPHRPHPPPVRAQPPARPGTVAWPRAVPPPVPAPQCLARWSALQRRAGAAPIHLERNWPPMQRCTPTSPRETDPFPSRAGIPTRPGTAAWPRTVPCPVPAPSCLARRSALYRRAQPGPAPMQLERNWPQEQHCTPAWPCETDPSPSRARPLARPGTAAWRRAALPPGLALQWALQHRAQPVPAPMQLEQGWPPEQHCTPPWP
mmetsp:Transcript_28419/g.75549  ORF Transcript_28419/g.75549 Transcript_28419/m.75549 type:complete len:212 (+) Transcript_28419:315-950(+)